MIQAEFDVYIWYQGLCHLLEGWYHVHDEVQR